MFNEEQSKEHEEKEDFVNQWELMVCSICHKPHSGFYCRCPHCDAGVYYQVGYEIEDYTFEELNEKVNEIREFRARKMIETGRAILKELGIEE
jgi:hypothetical protein